MPDLMSLWSFVGCTSFVCVFTINNEGSTVGVGYPIVAPLLNYNVSYIYTHNCTPSHLRKPYLQVSTRILPMNVQRMIFKVLIFVSKELLDNVKL